MVPTMQPREKISKSTWMVIEGVKSSVSTNITNAVRSGHLKIEQAHLPLLLTLLGASIDEGYHRAHRTLMKTVDVALNEAIIDGEPIPGFPAAPKK